MAEAAGIPGADEARRLKASEVVTLDLSVPDPRLVWAQSAVASSEYSSSYTAAVACGPPVVFPRGGDEAGTWLADSSDRDPWLELRFPATEAVGIVVLETCGAGALDRIVDAERDRVLWRGKARVLPDSRQARLFYLPLPAGGPPLSKLRLKVAPRSLGREWKEIDAVALVTVTLDELLASPPQWRTAVHRRYPPREVSKLRLRERDPRILWATKARASSEWSSSYAAKHATGRPKVFPKAGDIAGTWLPKSRGPNEWIELDFPPHEMAYGLIALETCGAGAIGRITDAEGEVLWEAPTDRLPEREAFLLHVPFEGLSAHRRLRLWLGGGIDDYREIDAVAILTAPFDELDRPAPEPPKPEDAWVRLEGTLEGLVVHATLRAPSGDLSANTPRGRLQLATGASVDLELGTTTVYGARLRRHRGDLAALREAAPLLMSAFDDVEVAGALELEGRLLHGGDAVVVMGEVTREAPVGGFRDSARAAPEELRPTAIAARGAEAALETHSPEAFRAPRRASPRAGRHPYGPWAIAMAVVTALILGVAWLQREPVTAFVALVPFALCFDFLGRVFLMSPVVPSVRSGLHDRRAAFDRVWAIVVWSVLVAPAAFMAGIFASLAVRGSGWDDDAALLAGVAGAAGLYALFRFVRLLRAQWDGLRTATRVLLTPSRPVPRKRARVSGVLAVPGAFEWREEHLAKSEHLGSYTETDDQGRPVTREQYEHWRERHVQATGPGQIVLALDGDILATAAATGTRTTVAGPRVRSGERSTIVAFRATHDEGDPATLVGVVVPGDSAWTVEEPRTLVLGDLAALRRRLAMQALVALLFLGAIGAATATAVQALLAP